MPPGVQMDQLALGNSPRPRLSSFWGVWGSQEAQWGGDGVSINAGPTPPRSPGPDLCLQKLLMFRSLVLTLHFSVSVKRGGF